MPPASVQLNVFRNNAFVQDLSFDQAREDLQNIQKFALGAKNCDEMN